CGIRRNGGSGNAHGESEPHRHDTALPRIPDSGSRIPAMIINQWVPAAHQGDAIGDSARRVRDILRRSGHTSDLFALTMDDELREDVRAFADPEARRGDVTIFHFALPSPMTAAFAALDGARVL